MGVTRASSEAYVRRRLTVDAMVEDNNDDVKEQLRRIEEKIDKISK